MLTYYLLTQDSLVYEIETEDVMKIFMKIKVYLILVAIFLSCQ